MTRMDRTEFYQAKAHDLHDGVGRNGAKTNSFGGGIDDIAFGNKRCAGVTPVVRQNSERGPIKETLAGSIPARVFWNHKQLTNYRQMIR